MLERLRPRPDAVGLAGAREGQPGELVAHGVGPGEPVERYVVEPLPGPGELVGRDPEPRPEHEKDVDQRGNRHGHAQVRGRRRHGKVHRRRGEHNEPKVDQEYHKVPHPAMKSNLIN